MSLMFVALSSLVSTVFAQEPIHIHQYDLRDRLTVSGDGGYNLYMQELLNFSSDDISLHIASLKRSSREFELDANSCLFPSNVAAWRRGKPEREKIAIISSKPIDFVSIYIYVARGQKVPASKQDLNDLRVGYELGSVGATFLKDTPVMLMEAHSNDQLLKMLDRGRVDAVMGFHPDIAIAFDRLGHDGLRYSPNFSLIKAATSIICRDTERNRGFIQRLDHGIVALNYSGKAQELLGKYAEIVPLDVVLTD